MKSITSFLIAGTLLFLLSCNSSNQRDITIGELKQEPEKGLFTPDDKEESDTDQFTDSAGSQAGHPPLNKQTKTSTAVTHTDWDKKIIRNAVLNLEVKEFQVYHNSVREKIRNLGGYLAEEEQNQTDYKIENNMVIKIPVDQFENAVNILTANVERINEKKVNSQDVTTEYIDTRSRMETKRQVRQRYLDLLKQAKNMEEILNVQSQVNGIQEEIESAAARIQYLGHSSAYSTINLTYFQVLDAAAKDNDKPSFGEKLSQAFRTGGNWMVDLCIGLVSIWPLFLLGFFSFLVYRRMKIQRIK